MQIVKARNDEFSFALSVTTLATPVAGACRAFGQPGTGAKCNSVGRRGTHRQDRRPVTSVDGRNHEQAVRAYLGNGSGCDPRSASSPGNGVASARRSPKF